MGVSIKIFVNWFAQSSKKHYLCSEFPLLVREGIFFIVPPRGRVHRCVSYGAAAFQPQRGGAQSCKTRFFRVEDNIANPMKKEQTGKIQ